MNEKLTGLAAAIAVAGLALWSSLELYTAMGKNPQHDQYRTSQHLARHAAITLPAGQKQVGFVTSATGAGRDLLLFQSRYALAPVLVVDSPDVFPRVRAEAAAVTLEFR